MALLTGLREGIAALSARGELDVEPGELPRVLDEWQTEAVLAAMREASTLIHDLEMFATLAAGVVARRSVRELGHGGAAAVRGHRDAVNLVQSVSGGTRADAVRAVRVGTSLVDGAMDASAAAAAPSAGSAVLQVVAVIEPWNAPLKRARFAGVLTSAQYDAILRGLGEPPMASGVAGAGSAGAGVCPEDEAAAAREVWRLAAEQLLAAAGELPVEELGRRARQVRDALDPVGAEERFGRRFAQRSLRHWVDADGVHHTKIVHDDEMGAWMQAIIDAAMRPRRGGPRFVDSAEVAAAKALESDPRTNEQLTYDLVMGVLRAGALAEASDVFGARQPGVRMVVVKDAIGPRDAVGRLRATGHLEDGGAPLPGSVIDRVRCETGTRDVVVDGRGNPLDVGREHRLFTAKQRIGYAVRDGGCRWPGCTTCASYTEAHHIDHWQADGGRTDTDRGILLCRFHHMALHNQGWKITRDGDGEFLLHAPPGPGPGSGSGGAGGSGRGEPGGAGPGGSGRGEPGAPGQVVAGAAPPPRVMPTRSPVAWAWSPPPPPARAHWRAAAHGTGADGGDAGARVEASHIGHLPDASPRDAAVASATSHRS